MQPFVLIRWPAIRLAHATFVGRTEWFRNYPYNYDSYGCEEWELLFSTFSKSRFANLTEPLYFYRELDSFTVAKYLRRQLRTSSFSWRHGRDQFGTARTAWECGKRFGRGFISRARVCWDVAERLVKRRYEPIDAASAEHLRSTIQQIRSNRLPVRSIGVQDPASREVAPAAEP